MLEFEIKMFQYSAIGMYLLLPNYIAQFSSVQSLSHV